MNQNAKYPVAAERLIGGDRALFGKKPGPVRTKSGLTGPTGYPRSGIIPDCVGTGTPDRIQALLRAGRFYLLSFVYGAAVYGFLVAYLLALGAMTEPMPAY